MKRAGLLAVAVLIAIGAGAGLLFFGESYRGFQGETFVTVERGTGATAIGRELAQAGVIRFPWQFWVERAMNPSAKLQAGEYRFDKGATPGEVFERLARGDVYYFEFTVPEGSNMFDIGRSLESAGVLTAADFLNAAEDPKLIADLDPSAQSLEGYLFPSTYRLSHSITPGIVMPRDDGSISQAMEENRSRESPRGGDARIDGGERNRRRRRAPSGGRSVPEPPE